MTWHRGVRDWSRCLALSFSQLKTWGQGELADTVGMVLLASEQYQSGEMTKEMFEDIEKASGLNANPLGLLADDILRSRWDLVGIMRLDWVHNTLQNGMMTIEAWLFI